MSVSDDVEVSMILKFKVSSDLFYVNFLFIEFRGDCY